MPVNTTTCLPSPAAPERHHADRGLTIVNPGSGTANSDFQSLFEVGDFVFSQSAAFLRLLMPDVPAEANIVSATLRLLPRSASADTIPVAVALLARDGKWDDTSATNLWNTEPTFDVVGQVIATDFTVQGITTTTLVGSSGFPMNTDNEVFQAGQAFLITSTRLCLGAQIGMKRIGNPTGNIRLRLERCMADDGSDDRPNGTVLATSLNVAASSVSTAANGGLVTFQFSTFALLSVNQRFCFIVEIEYPENPTDNYLELRYFPLGIYNGSLVLFGTRLAFNTPAYIADSRFPFLRLADLTTPNVAPFAGLELDVSFPPMTNDVWYEQDVTSLVQAWVDDPSFVENDVIGFHLFPDGLGPAGVAALFNDFELVVEWEPTEIWSRVDDDAASTTPGHWCHPYTAGVYADDPSEIEYDPNHIAADPSGICGDAQGGWASKDAAPATPWTRVDD